MSRGTFTDFENALRAFESGVDEARYLSGDISQAQLEQWLGTATWTALQSGEISWREAQYKSMNSLGFVGYQLGEALLIDLGYYSDSVYYDGDGDPATNTWDGTFTGKGGVTSLAALKTPLQEGVMLDAFAFNLGIIRNGLAAQGQDLDDIIGQTRTYQTSSGNVTVEFSLTGILAAAHLRGAYGTLDLLLNNTQTTDENGTSILKYLNDFGGYDPIDQNTLLNARANGTTGALAELLWGIDFNGDGVGGPQFTSGADSVTGSAIADTLRALGGNDTVSGGDGSDTIFGDGGDDTLTGGRGNDTLHGGADNDTLIGGAGKDALDGGAGSDAASYAAATSGVVASLANASINTGEAAGDTYVSIERLTGSAFADTLAGTNGANNTLRGGAGNDTLKGYTGNDALEGGAGNDTFVFNTALNASTNVDTILDFNNRSGNDDRFLLDDAFFAGISGDPAAGGRLLSGFYKNITTGAQDANDKILYRQSTGELIYDSNGLTAGGQTVFAKVTVNTALTFQDFFVT